MTSPSARRQPTLETERLILRPFTAADAPRVQTLAGAREVADTTLTIPHPYPDGLAEEWIKTHAPAWESGRRAIVAISNSDAGVIGGISLHDIDADESKAEMGFWVG